MTGPLPASDAARTPRLDVDRGADTPVWPAISTDPAATVSGAFFHDRTQVEVSPLAYDGDCRIAYRCAVLCGADLP